MKTKKLLSVILAVVLVASSIAIALAESADTTEATAAEPTAAPAAGETTQADSFTTDEMLSTAMADAYARQAAYAAYAEAYPESWSINNLNVDSQIVLLEMLLKANDVALPAADTDVTVPDTLADTYVAIANAESSAVETMRSYLAQETLGEDAQIIFRTVRKDSYQNAVTFARKSRIAQREQAWTELLNDENTQVVVTEGDTPYGGHYKRTVYTYNSNGVIQPEPTDTPDTTEDSVSD